MKKILVITVIFITSLTACKQQDQYHDSFFEDFSSSTPEYFQHRTGGKGADFSWTFGVDSPTEPGTKILSFKIDPEDVAGAGRGPEIISNQFTNFGTYAARLRVPDVKDIQPDVGAVIGYFTYHMDSVHGLSEIDFEWLIADPKIIYVGTWTGPRGDLRRIGRTINMAKGIIYSTTYREGHNGIRRPLLGIQNQPDTIPAIEGYDASSQFYTYGFDWYPDHLRWWMIHPVTADTVDLWDYQGSQVGIPQNHTRYRLNFWHTDNWPVQTNPNSIEKPLHPYEVEIDWMTYDPIEINKRQKSNIK
ncbi:MAG: glycoside hydrolase family 16 protein [Cyclobacteriaceae bacterium]|nr:glycoside hydrolase family 16 protein [Cyclobacteriaceae bacterium]